jgi:hypothetical protein
MSKIKTIGLGLSLAALIGLGAACSVPEDADKADAPTDDAGTDTTISSGLGSQDATADVGAPILDAPDAIGVSYLHIPVTNNSSGRSDYFIEVAIESADGATQYETTLATLSGVEPGQAASAEGMVAWGSDPAPADATVRITTVQRMASA